jgi:hypothetical protein
MRFRAIVRALIFGSAGLNYCRRGETHESRRNANWRSADASGGAFSICTAHEAGGITMRLLITAIPLRFSSTTHHPYLAFWLAMGAALLTGTAASQQATADIIINGGFEEGNFSGWTASSGTVATTNFDGFKPHAGDFFAAIGSAHSLGTLSQTIGDTSGQSYTLSMFLGSDGGTPNEFRVDWNNTTFYDRTNLPDTRGNNNQYDLLTFTVLGTGTDTLTIYSRNDPGFLALDDVSLTPAPPDPTPVPSTLVMSSILFGMFGVVWTYKKLRQSVLAA